MVAAFRLEENEWIWLTYEKMVQWANAYLCDKFCAGLRTTSRYEDINTSLKRFIKSSNCLLELVENLERVAKDYRNNEFITNYKSLYSKPVMTTGLESIERAISQIYTKEIFFEVKKEIECVVALIILHRKSYGSTEKFMFRKFRKPHRVYSVLYESNSERYECSCKLWNNIGIPCSHIICVLKELEKDVLPMGLVLKKCCKDAKFGSFHDSDGGLDRNKAFSGTVWFVVDCLLPYEFVSSPTACHA
ncbi:protein FAR1-RELATED SEQUENCE 9-like [Arachis ipaensis]|uniref:Protein FAR1-RELATED SEQUENCE n=1 Tax=Arachis hypogaea TaxID=3818 RepID=A0A444X6A2_ARAHY|nr:protein FAR1-RELATED SEQUENCE 9-like [Arachis ipaensis]XP_025685410.1 protein FAR1-RELATED SEQUENCE 9-like [Arachis hypogaea]RYQ85201.1 hypothetical protein Ahy_B10g104703 [Arachis hypogaea]